MRTHTVFPDEFPESWASDWGEDEYGIFMGFTYKGVRQDFRWIEPGSFQMGSPADEPERYDYETRHEVTLSRGFWLADTCVTQALWEAVMGENHSRFQGTNHPVENVSWEVTQAFIARMNEMKAALRLCLPTEAQWEYACRAGTSTPFCFGEGITPNIVNYSGRYPYHNGSEGKYRKQTVEVGSLPPNAWGLYEIHGNVLEWCQDWFGEYGAAAQVDPKGPEEGSRRVLRGGSWYDSGGHCRSAYRYGNGPSYHGDNFGFRLARGL
ncbi:MAG: formylglycine-generating enzyme family protein [Candidatus Thiodiazotropha endolucinida]|nr:formylglycine-generating enzyme family protein [Candidatus Thiodiazotropha taylori]MCW4312024.1 formylglycine-generating enzyme family protein [Candidatus Thiodiazotropha taylori]